jgi:glycosyltransferase involved in cell wall biosynthesis
MNLTIVIPIYNSNSTISELIESLNSSFEHRGNFKVIFVNDGSIQNCSERILNCHKVFPYELIELNKNYGQHVATSYGLSKVRTEYAATMDDDLQHKPEFVLDILDLMKESDFDLVYGTYKEKKHSFFRNISSRFIKLLLKIENTNFELVTSLRVMKSHLLQSIDNNSVHFLDYALLQSTDRVSYYEIEHQYRKDQSSYSLKKLIFLSLKFILFHSAIPLRFITVLGLLFSIFSMIAGIYFMCLKLLYGAPLGYTSLIVTVFFSSGVIITSLGVVSEFIRRIWVKSNYSNSVIVRKFIEG